MPKELDNDGLTSEQIAGMLVIAGIILAFLIGIVTVPKSKHSNKTFNYRIEYNCFRSCDVSFTDSYTKEGNCILFNDRTVCGNFNIIPNK